MIIILSSPLNMNNFSIYQTTFAQNGSVDNSNNSNTSTSFPSLSLFSKNNNQLIEDLKPRSMQLLISFNSGSGTNTMTNDPNFAFTTSQWPSIFNGEIINISFGGNAGDSSLMQPSGVIVTLVMYYNLSQALTLIQCNWEPIPIYCHYL
jgi:hypothetical protein